MRDKQEHRGSIYVIAIALLLTAGWLSSPALAAGRGQDRPERTGVLIDVMNMLGGVTASSASEETDASPFQPPGFGSTPPGQGDDPPPGQTTPPGQGSTPPGQGDTPPAPPGHDGSPPPGHGGDPPGHGNGNGNGNRGG